MIPSLCWNKLFKLCSQKGIMRPAYLVNSSVWGTTARIEPGTQKSKVLLLVCKIMWCCAGAKYSLRCVQIRWPLSVPALRSELQRVRRPRKHVTWVFAEVQNNSMLNKSKPKDRAHKRRARNLKSPIEHRDWKRKRDYAIDFGIWLPQFEFTSSCRLCWT